MLLSRRALLYCGLSIPTVCADNPPVAKRIEHTEVRHRATINDPYFWLREKSNPEAVVSRVLPPLSDGPDLLGLATLPSAEGRGTLSSKE